MLEVNNSIILIFRTGWPFYTNLYVFGDKTFFSKSIGTDLALKLHPIAVCPQVSKQLLVTVYPHVSSEVCFCSCFIVTF